MGVVTAVGLFALFKVDVNSDPIESQRFVTAPMLLAPVVGAMVLALAAGRATLSRAVIAQLRAEYPPGSLTAQEFRHADALLRRAEAILLAEAPVIPLYHVPMRRFHAASVRGWHENLLDLHPLKFVSLAP
jgi:hypothetical protein